MVAAGSHHWLRAHLHAYGSGFAQGRCRTENPDAELRRRRAQPARDGRHRTRRPIGQVGNNLKKAKVKRQKAKDRSEFDARPAFLRYKRLSSALCRSPLLPFAFLLLPYDRYACRPVPCTGMPCAGSTSFCNANMHAAASSILRVKAIEPCRMGFKRSL